MGFIFDAILWDLMLGIVFLFCLLYIYMTSDFSYWKNRSIAYIKPSFPFGTDKDLFFFRKSQGEHFQSVYTKFSKEKAVGMFQLRKPYLLVRDQQLLKQIMTKDFNHFVDRDMGDPELLSPITTNLFNMRGEAWKIMRHKLTPAFTSGKMKMMYFLIETCSKEFVKSLEPIAERNEKIEIKDYIARFTTDVIASCAFGLESNSIKNPDNELRKNGNMIFQAPSTFVMIKMLFFFAFPWISKKLHLIKPFTNGSEGFFLKIIGDTVAYRERNNVVRNDFIDLMIKIKNNKSLVDDEINGANKDDQEKISNCEVGLTLEEMTAQAILFFAAGFETSASALSFCLYEISVNPKIQEKLRKEIDEVLLRHNGLISYHALKDMIYMEAVLNETLRRYASLSVLNRTCTEDYKLPELNIVIPKGMTILIPVYAIHHDPQIYPDPYKFDPERFTNNKTKSKNNYNFLPFGEGPRMCIGNRFAMMQMKMCLTMLLQKFELTITEDTPIPLTISKKQFFTTPASPIILKISKRNTLLDQTSSAKIRCLNNNDIVI